MSLPRDFLDEIEIELAAARRSITRDCTRTAVLAELQRLAQAVTQELGWRVTVFDFIGSATTHEERERRVELVRQLRA